MSKKRDIRIIQNSISKGYKFSRRSFIIYIIYRCEIRSCIHEYVQSYRMNLMPQVAIYYRFHSGVISNVTNVVETGDARKSGRVEFENGSATRELHKPVQALLSQPRTYHFLFAHLIKPRSRLINGKLI